MIGHSYNNGTYPDKTSYHHRRYQTAVKVVEYALKSLQDDIYCDGEEVIKALKQIYTDEATYKMIKIKKYVNDNGYSNAILSKVNIDTPKIPKSWNVFCANKITKKRKQNVNYQKYTKM